eukprot:2759192-Alexandrium_andersonii.AAC.1
MLSMGRGSWHWHLGPMCVKKSFASSEIFWCPHELSVWAKPSERSAGAVLGDLRDQGMTLRVRRARRNIGMRSV